MRAALVEDDEVPPRCVCITVGFAARTDLEVAPWLGVRAHGELAARVDVDVYCVAVRCHASRHACATSGALVFRMPLCGRPCRTAFARGDTVVQAVVVVIAGGVPFDEA